MYGSKLDSILDIVDKFRGVIGGVLGTFVGAVVDVSSVYRKWQQTQTHIWQQPIPNAATTNLPGRPTPATVPAGGIPSTTGAAQGAASGTTAAAGSVAGAAGAAAGAASAAGPIIAAVAIAIIALVRIAEKIVAAIDRAENRYAQYSPQIAQAQALAEVQTTLNDMRRAQEIAPEMVKYIQSRADLENKWEDIKVKILTKLMPIITAIMDVLEGSA